jgi:hypothetical protein
MKPAALLLALLWPLTTAPHVTVPWGIHEFEIQVKAAEQPPVVRWRVYGVGRWRE